MDTGNSRKRRRKLKFAVVEDDWGLGDGQDLRRMEEEENAKRSFLEDGQIDCQAGKLERQTTLRIWTEAEILCRELAIECIHQSKIIGNFKSNLAGQLRVKMDKEEQKAQKRAEESPEKLEGGKDGQLEEKERIPEGNTQLKKARTIPKKNNIKILFAKQHQKANNILEEELRKEERWLPRKGWKLDGNL